MIVQIIMSTPNIVLGCIDSFCVVVFMLLAFKKSIVYIWHWTRQHSSAKPGNSARIVIHSSRDVRDRNCQNCFTAVTSFYHGCTRVIRIVNNISTILYGTHLQKWSSSGLRYVRTLRHWTSYLCIFKPVCCYVLTNQVWFLYVHYP